MQKKYKIILVCLAVGFFLIYSAFSIIAYLPYAKSRIIFDWPDEMANYFFIKNFKLTNSFVAAEPLNALINNPYIHPRSVNIVDNAIVPMSFLGMLIIYGALAKIISMYGVLFLTPSFGVLTVVFLSLIMKRLFGKIAGIASAVLCFIAPGFWYYSSQPMLPNILFLFLATTELHCVIRAFDGGKKKHLFGSAAGLFFGFAVITRTMDAIWMAGILLALFVIYRKKIMNNWQCLLTILCVGILPILLMLFLNNEIYGKIFTVGYLRQDQPTFLSGLPTEFKVADSGILGWLKFIVAPFGLHARAIWWVVWEYIIKINWPFFILAMASVGWLFVIKKIKIEKIFLGFALAITGWLALFYGNWIFSDKMVLKYNDLSSSYTRYFLPIYLICALLIAWLTSKLWSAQFNKIAKIFICSGLVGLFIYSAYLVCFNSADGLLMQKQKMDKYHYQRQLVEKQIPSDAVLIVDRADKIFWPKYKVVIFQGDFGIFLEMKKLLKHVSIYYYSEIPEEVMKQINEKKLRKLELNFTKTAEISGGMYLYQLCLQY